MSNLKQRWSVLRIDLKKHLTLGLAIAFVVTLAAFPVTLAVMGGDWIPAAILAALSGLSAGVLAGWVKEYVIDKSGHGTVDRDDYLYTGRGSVVGAALALALLLLRHFTSV